MYSLPGHNLLLLLLLFLLAVRLIQLLLVLLPMQSQLSGHLENDVPVKASLQPSAFTVQAAGEFRKLSGGQPWEAVVSVCVGGCQQNLTQPLPRWPQLQHLLKLCLQPSHLHEESQQGGGGCCHTATTGGACLLTRRSIMPHIATAASADVPHNSKVPPVLNDESVMPAAALDFC